MGHALNEALSILIVGMLTVLLILGLVVVIGNLIIRITNKFWPAPETSGKGGKGKQSIPSGTMAAIVSAVDTITGGRGKVTKVEKK